MAAEPSEHPAPPALAGQVALVTGASRGIGADIAVALAEAGVHVACAGTQEENARSTAEAVLYLAGPGAGFVTGTVLEVDGGWDAYGYL